MKIFNKIPETKPKTPLLDKVSVPSDIRSFSISELKILSDELREFLLERKINTGIYYPSLLYTYPSMKEYQSSCPNAEILVKEVLSLPVHPALSDSDVFEVISSIKAFFD